LDDKDALIKELQTHNDYLKQLLAEKEGHIGQLYHELELLQMTLDEVLQASREARERADNMILQLTTQIGTLVLDETYPLWQALPDNRHTIKSDVDAMAWCYHLVAERHLVCRPNRIAV
jgi:hypothetical protein